VAAGAAWTDSGMASAQEIANARANGFIGGISSEVGERYASPAGMPTVEGHGVQCVAGATQVLRPAQGAHRGAQPGDRLKRQ
jgi:hypothetical protein